MNLRCKVCGEKAAGFHFGAFTCEGCKSFFGRCCNNMSTIGACRNNKVCIIDKKNRTSCKACRLQKCLQVGMSKSGSRYGRRSNWFKQYFQETEQRRQILDDVKNNETDDANIVIDHRYRRPSTSPSTKDHHRQLLSKVNVSSETIRFVTPKIYPDLVLSTPAMSSHFYANYFPHLANFSRFLTSPSSLSPSPSYNGRESRFFADCEPMTLFNGFDFRNVVNECCENIRKCDDQAYDKELPLSSRADDPLDLSSNSRNVIGKSEQEGRKTMPLDLSVK